jgi:hypothetical protein
MDADLGGAPFDPERMADEARAFGLSVRSGYRSGDLTPVSASSKQTTGHPRPGGALGTATGTGAQHGGAESIGAPRSRLQSRTLEHNTAGPIAQMDADSGQRALDPISQMDADLGERASGPIAPSLRENGTQTDSLRYRDADQSDLDRWAYTAPINRGAPLAPVTSSHLDVHDDPRALIAPPAPDDKREGYAVIHPGKPARKHRGQIRRAAPSRQGSGTTLPESGPAGRVPDYLAIDLSDWVDARKKNPGSLPTEDQIGQRISAQLGFAPDEYSAFKQEHGYGLFAIDPRFKNVAIPHLLDRAQADPYGRAAVGNLDQLDGIAQARSWLVKHRLQVHLDQIASLPEETNRPFTEEEAEAVRRENADAGPDYLDYLIKRGHREFPRMEAVNKIAQVRPLTPQELDAAGIHVGPLMGAINAFVSGASRSIGESLSGIGQIGADWLRLTGKAVDPEGTLGLYSPLNARIEELFGARNLGDLIAKLGSKLGPDALQGIGGQVQRGEEVYQRINVPDTPLNAVSKGLGAIVPDLALSYALPEVKIAHALFWPALAYTKARGEGKSQAQAVEAAIEAALMLKAGEPLAPLARELTDSRAVELVKRGARAVLGGEFGFTSGALQPGATRSSALSSAVQFGLMNAKGAEPGERPVDTASAPPQFLAGRHSYRVGAEPEPGTYHDPGRYMLPGQEEWDYERRPGSTGESRELALAAISDLGSTRATPVRNISRVFERGGESERGPGSEVVRGDRRRGTEGQAESGASAARRPASIFERESGTSGPERGGTLSERESDTSGRERGGRGADAGLPREPGVRGQNESQGNQTRLLGLGITPELVRAGRVDLRGHQVRDEADIATIGQVYRDPRFETFRIIYVNGDNVVATEGISSRLPDSTAAFVTNRFALRYYNQASKKYGPNRMDWPSAARDRYHQLIREGEGRALNDMRLRMHRLGADGYFLLHNHPSGDPLPSEGDRSVTALYESNVPGFRGHVIIDSKRFGFIRPFSKQEIQSARALVPGHLNPGNVRRLTADILAAWRNPEVRPIETDDSLLEPSIHHELLGRSAKTSSDLAALGQAMKDGNGVTLFYLSQGKIRAIETVPEKLYLNSREMTNHIRGRARAYGGMKVAAYSELSRPLVEAGRNLIAAGVLHNAVTHDVGLRDIYGEPPEFEGPAGGLRVEEKTREPEPEQDDYLRAASDPRVTSYPGALRIEKYRGLNAAQRSVEARMAHYAELNTEQILRDYEAANTKDGTIRIDLDQMREHLPLYSQSNQSRAEHSSSVHNAAGALIDSFWNRLLNRPDAPKWVLFTGGGGGSGKGTSTRTVAASLGGEPSIVFDSTMAGLETSRARIDVARKAGKRVGVLFTYADPYQAARRAFARAADHDGRTVPNTALAHAHFEAPRTFLALYRRYGRDPNIAFWVLQNTGLEKDISQRDIDYLRQVVNNRSQGEAGKRYVRQEINRGIDDEYRERAATGQTPEDYIYRGFTGHDPPRIRPARGGRRGGDPQGGGSGSGGPPQSPRPPPAEGQNRLGDNRDPSSRSSPPTSSHNNPATTTDISAFQGPEDSLELSLSAMRREIVPAHRIAEEGHRATDAAQSMLDRAYDAAVTSGRFNGVDFFFGGTGSGKSVTSEPTPLSAERRAGRVILESHAENAGKLAAKMDKARNAGLPIDVHVVIRDPVESFKSVVDRYNRAESKQRGSGKAVPVNYGAATHEAVINNVPKLIDRYADDPLVRWHFIDNKGTPVEAEEVTAEDGLGLLGSIDTNDLPGKFNDVLDDSRLTRRDRERFREPSLPAEFGLGLDEGSGASTAEREATRYGDENVVFTKDRLARAQEAVRRKLNPDRLNAGIDPTVLPHLLTIAGYHLEAGSIAFAEWSSRMVHDVGDWIVPHLDRLYIQALEYVYWRSKRAGLPPDESGLLREGSGEGRESFEDRWMQGGGQDVLNPHLSSQRRGVAAGRPDSTTSGESTSERNIMMADESRSQSIREIASLYKRRLGEEKNARIVVRGAASYKVDESGRTLLARILITGPHRGRRKGYRPEPGGGRSPGEHRGHLAPEGGADNPTDVNVKENIISEARRSNLGPKKKFDLLASRVAQQNVGALVESLHLPAHRHGETRPHLVTHAIFVNGRLFHTITIPNE